MTQYVCISFETEDFIYLFIFLGMLRKTAVKISEKSIILIIIRNFQLKVRRISVQESIDQQPKFWQSSCVNS